MPIYSAAHWLPSSDGALDPPDDGVARAVLKKSDMLIPETLIESRESKIEASDFWKRILLDEELRHCDNLQKLLAGCEIIAALDGVDLLAAQ